MYTESILSDTPPKAQSHCMTDRYVVKTLHRDEVVLDRTTGLMWQQSASSQQMIYSLARKWINGLNKRGFGGFNDWRLPTLEEAMTLMEPSPNSQGMYTDSIFDCKRRLWIWTSDRGGANSAWYVNFNYGYSRLNRMESSHNYVRAVRQREE